MATQTYHEYTGDGSKTDFDYSFEPIKIEDVKVALNGVTQTTGYTATLSPAKVVFTSAPADGVKVRVYRDTDVDSPKAVYAAGSSIRALDLNNNHDQLLYALQEEQNQKNIFEEIKLDDGVKIKLGNSAGDAEIYYKDNNFLQIESNGSIVLDTDAGNFVVSDGGVAKFGWSSNSALGVYSADHIRPYADNTYDLGSSSKEWKDLYVDGTAYIDTISADSAAINGNLVVTGTISDFGGNLELADDVNISGHLRFPDDKKIYLGNDDDASIDWDTDGWVDRLQIESAGDIQFKAASGKKYSVLVDSAIPLQIFETYILPRVDIKPYPTGNLDLGKSDGKWKDLYVDGTGYIDTVSADDITGSAIVTSGTSTSDTKLYSAKRAGEIFYEKGTLDDITSGDTWVGDDNKLATTGAIDARIVDLVDDVGGFVPIANETSFPNANPDVNNGAGTIVSIGSLASNLTSNGSGVISISNGTVGNSTVTINGAANSTTYSAGYGMLVETTSTLNTYTFHRLSSKATEVTTVAGSIANVNTVAGQITPTNNIATVAGISSNVTTVAGDTTAINNITTNLTAVQNAATNATNAASSATSAATSATTATTQATTATTQATNAASSATSAASSASTATTQASTATTQASNASTSAANALASKNLALTYRNDANGILTQVESAPYNLAANVSSHTAWGDITDTGANAVFANESSNIHLTMSEGSSSYNYGSIT